MSDIRCFVFVNRLVQTPEKADITIAEQIVKVRTNRIFVNLSFLKVTSIDSIEREMAPTTKRPIASRHLVSESCSCWVLRGPFR